MPWINRVGLEALMEKPPPFRKTAPMDAVFRDGGGGREQEKPPGLASEIEK